MSKHQVIIGAGPAATNAVKTIRQHLMVVGCFLFCFMSYSTFAFSADTDELHRKLLEIAKSYNANKNSFTKGRCVFRHIYSRGKNAVDPASSEWVETRKPRSQTFTWIWKDDAFVVGPQIDIESTQEDVQEDEWSISHEVALYKAGYYIDYFTAGAIVGSLKDRKLNVKYHPFNLSNDALINPATIIEYSQKNNFKDPILTLEENVAYAGGKYTRITAKGDSSSHHLTFYLDPQKGFLPIISESYDKMTGKISTRMVLTGMRKYHGNWFPMRSLKITELLSGAYEVREMKVIKLNLKFDPTDVDLTALLSKHTQYSHRADPYTAKTLYRNQKDDFVPISVNDIKGIYNSLKDIAKQRREEEQLRKKVKGS